MSYKFHYIFFLFLFCVQYNAQSDSARKISGGTEPCGDIIVFKNNWSCKVKILQITETEVIYKRCTNLKEPSERAFLKDINTIKYRTDTALTYKNADYIVAERKKRDSVFVRSGLKKNVIYATLALVPDGVALTGTLERMLFETRNNFAKSIWIDGFAGATASVGGTGQYCGLSFTSLSGTGNNHFEINLGAICLYDKESYRSALSDYNYFTSMYGPDYETKPKTKDYLFALPLIGIGYRYQAPGEHFVFRTGVSFPEPVYLSLGFCF